MAIYVWVVEKGGIITKEILESQSQFNLMENRGIYCHLKHLWEQVSAKTGMSISDNDDAFYEQPNLSIFLDLIKNEITESQSIPVDEWTFSLDKQVVKTINNEEFTPDKYDSVKAYVAEWFIKSYPYEVIHAIQSDLILEVKKQYYTVKKLELLNFLATLKFKIEFSINQEQRLYFSYG